MDDEDEIKNIYDYHSQPDKLIHWADIDRLPWGAFAKIRHLKKSKQKIPLSLLETISLSPKYAYAYARSVIGKPWPPGEAAIATDPRYSYAYASYVIKDAWPPGEALISQNPYWAWQYAKYVIKDAWPPGEAAIANGNWMIVLDYAVWVLGKLWPPADQALIKADAKGELEMNGYLERYLRMVTVEAMRARKRISPELELVMFKFPSEAMDYINFVIRGPSADYEKDVFDRKDYYGAVSYAKEVLEKPWPEAELIIAQSWPASQDYCKTFPDRYENFLRIWKENPDLLLFPAYVGENEKIFISHREKISTAHAMKLKDVAPIVVKSMIKNKQTEYRLEPVVALDPKSRATYLEKFPQRKAAIEFLVNELRSRLGGVIKI